MCIVYDGVIGIVEYGGVAIRIDRNQQYEEFFMPTICWLAPEIPKATYSSGATVIPDCPICLLLGSRPFSTRTRVPPISAPTILARIAILSMSGCSTPRPTENTILAFAKEEAPVLSDGRQAINFLTVVNGKLSREGMSMQGADTSP